ncbi:tectonic-3 [Protobothrops mucrosquamatus]|uniref:tectonic-3 n=1 Tax=Protobothrops mucrosquamatus TaxID=103944 RepID=UPI000775AE78|nr:tectonic-3 [Protobothrops mucrosquamatus]
MAAWRLLFPLLLLLSELWSKTETDNVTLKAENSTDETSPTGTPPSETTLPGTSPSGTSPSKTSPSKTPHMQTKDSADCPCDLHPGFCDINCCCDSHCGSECNLGAPGCPFSFCLPGSTRAVSRVCLEKSLIFRNNTPFHTEILPGPDGCILLFCVQLNDSTLNYLQVPQMVTKVNFPILSAQYGKSSFILPEQVWSSSSAFYQMGDPIQIYYAASSTLSVLKQPVGIGTSQICTDENPAGFLESKTTSCIRIFTDLMRSCTSDPALDAASYYRNFSVLQVPVNFSDFQLFKVHIIPHSEPAAPGLNGNTCHNVVSEVNYEMEFNGIHGIQKVYVQFKLTNISGNAGVTLQQSFSLHFGSRRPSLTKRRSGNPGYITGAPLRALYNGIQQHVTILQNQANGQCSAAERFTVQFGENVRMGCQFRIPFKPEERSCSDLQELFYQAFEGGLSTGHLAITGNADPGHPEQWTRVFTQRCKLQDGHCMIPISLKIQVIWANVGLLSNPQAQVLGARYYYLCRPLKSLGIYMNMLPLTSTVTFTDVTKWPESPHGQPDIYSKLPFDFFFPFKMALNEAVNGSCNILDTLLMSLMLYGIFVSF